MAGAGCSVPPSEVAEEGAGAVRAQRRLWAELREVHGYDDNDAHSVYVTNLLHLLCLCTMVSFEAASFCMAGNTWACMGHTTFGLLYFLEICILCECAHRTVSVVRTRDMVAQQLAV